jgi:hypothetical protein
MTIEVNPTIMGQIYCYCESIKAECKPMSLMPLQSRYIDKVEEYVKKQGLNIYSEDLSEGWKTIYIFKHEFILEIIKNLPEHPQTPFEHWIVGKACGYSDNAIMEFIKTKL